ncbi:hypothetical protein ACHWQZ_G006346 [Mnemiopsis leidyi]
MFSLVLLSLNVMKLRSGRYLEPNTQHNVQPVGQAEESVDQSPEKSLLTDASLISDATLPSSPSCSPSSSSTYSSANSRSPSPHQYYDPADNYEIGELESGDETDDEDEPSQEVPAWVSDIDAFLDHQFVNISHAKIFGPYPSPDLDMLFKTKRPQFKNRTSSAVWNSVPVKCGDLLADSSGMDFSTLTIEELSE